MPRIDTLLLDLDGVVCVPPGLHAARLEREMALTREDTREFFRGDFQRCITGDANLREVIAPYLAQWGWAATVDAFLDDWFTTEHVMDAGLIDRVDRLRAEGTFCALATNQECHRLAYLRERMGFATRFDAVYASAELGVAKPEPAFYDAIALRTRCAPGAIVFFDDHAPNVEAAKRAGWKAHLYSSLEEFDRVIATYV